MKWLKSKSGFFWLFFCYSVLSAVSPLQVLEICFEAEGHLTIGFGQTCEKHQGLSAPCKDLNFLDFLTLDKIPQETLSSHDDGASVILLLPWPEATFRTIPSRSFIFNVSDPLIRCLTTTILLI